MTRILVVDDSAFNLKVVSATLAPAGYEVVTAQSGREALERVDAVQPDLIILDVMMPELNGYEVCRRHDYMSKPFEAPELQARVKALLRRYVAVKPEAEAISLQGKVIAVFSLRGGIGVSTIASNLAVGLAQIWGCHLAFASGQSALMLNLPLRNTWGDLARAEASDIDADLLDSVLLPHPSGARVLATPPRPEQSELITAEKVARIISLLKDRHEYVVLDLPHDFSETTLAGLDSAHQILTPLAPELASVRAMACALDVFGHLDYPGDRTSLVLNTTFERGGLARKDIETALKQPIALTLPFAGEVLLGALNRGVPVVAEAPHKPIGAALEDLALFVSKEEHRKQRPAHPTEAWQRVAQRMNQRRQRAS
jgi:pilus assembly protein CpaE